MNVLQIIDLFGKPIYLNFNGVSHAKTRAGGIFSLLFTAFVIWSTYNASQDLFAHSAPKTISSEFFNENPDQMILGPDSFTFGFGIQDPDTYAHYIDDSVYTFNVVKNRLDNVVKSDGTIEQRWSSVKLETERCKTSHFGELGDKFANLELNQLYCFTPAQTAAGEVKVQGVFESPVFELVSIRIVECNPAERVCASEERRKALLEGGYFAIYFTNMAFNPKDFNDPSFRYRDSTYTTFGRNYYKEIAFTLSHVEVTSDSGWIISEPSTKNYIKFDTQTEMLNLKDGLAEFFSFNVRVNKITIKHERSYIKVQDISAEVNGLVSIALLVIFIVVSPYSNLKFYESLINELFEIKTSKGKSQRIKKVLKKQLSDQIASYIKPKNNDDEGRDKQEGDLRIMTPTGAPFKLDFENASPDLEIAKQEKEPKIHRETQKTSFLRLTLDDLGSELAQKEQERQIYANRNNRKKMTTLHQERESTPKMKVEQEQGNNEVKVLRGNLKKQSYYKAIVTEDMNALLVNTEQQTCGDKDPKAIKKKSSLNNPSLAYNICPPKTDREQEKRANQNKGKGTEKKFSFSKDSLPGSLNNPLANQEEKSKQAKDVELFRKDQTKSRVQKVSITDNLNTQPEDIDEYKDNKLSSNIYSAELGRNPFNYPVKQKRTTEVESQQTQGINHKDPNQTSAWLSGEKLQQDIPRAVKPNLRVRENDQNNMDSIEVILDTIGLDKQQGRKGSEEVERMQMTPRDAKNQESPMTNVMSQLMSCEDHQEERDVIMGPPMTGDQEKEQGREKREEGEKVLVKQESNEVKMSRKLGDQQLMSSAVGALPRGAMPRKSIILKEEPKLHLTFWEYIKSYLWMTDELKEKLSVLNEGRRRIDERLDIFNVFKKLREVDKLKLLFLENEQLVLFDGLPKPELTSKNAQLLEGSKSLSRHLLKEARFIIEKRRQDLIAISYENLKEKSEITPVDQKLIDIYDDMAINT